MNKKIILAVAFMILILSTLIFIWSNSLQSVDKSSAVSDSVLEAVKPVYEQITGKTLASYILRKSAHFAEFALLGAEIAAFIALIGHFTVSGVFNSLFVCLSSAVTDEALQIISLRGSQVSDVLLDFSGSLAGFVLTAAVYFTVRLIKHVNKKGMSQKNHG